ncbi:MAG: hypothetical protein JXD19_11980 [Deltaproteobacteria bacterium]|nr:hypothetical protein [Deltaproteobacteria bacterium]
MERFLLGIQHFFNPLHVYCRLVESGINRRTSIRLSSYYEIIIFPWLARLTVNSLSLLRHAKKT